MADGERFAYGRFYDAATQTRYWHFPAETLEHWQARKEENQNKEYTPPRRPENAGLLTLADLEGGGYTRREWTVRGPYVPTGLTDQAEIIRTDYNGEHWKGTTKRISENPDRSFRSIERLAEIIIGKPISGLESVGAVGIDTETVEKPTSIC